MIPIHDILGNDSLPIKMEELASLTIYDSSEPHRHQYFECFVFLNGGGVHLIDFVEFPIHSFSVHIVTPGQVHQVKRNPNSNGYVFLFDLLLFDHLKNIETFLFDHTCFDVNEFAPSYQFDASFNAELEHIVNYTWKEFNSDYILKNQIVINQLSLILMHCMRNKMKGTKEDSNIKTTQIYTEFRRMLNAEFKNLKKVKEYASKLNISEKQLNEIVLNRSGETASAFIHKQIILEAKRLLNLGMSTKETAYELNFMDPAHFSKFFKTQSGISASDFKKIHH